MAKMDSVFHSMAEALAEAQQKEQALTEIAADIICSLDENGKFTKLNQVATKIWGFERDDLLDSQIYALLSANERDRIREAARHAKQTAQILNAEINVQRKDLSICEMSISMHWSQVEHLFFCVLHDISERKQAERLKQEVLAMVSHDLRAPLTNLSVMFDLFETGRLGQLNENGELKVQLGRNVIQQLMSLINDLLDMEKLESGMFELDYKVKDVHELVATAVDSLSGSAAKKSVHLLLPEAHPALECDGDRIIRVLTNLLDNAIKYSFQGGTVSVKITESDTEVRIEIIDQSRGIPDDKVDSIFERFKQADISDDREKRGSGLGLAICKAIIEVHGGRIGVESGGTSGSTFWIALPKTRPLRNR